MLFFLLFIEIGAVNGIIGGYKISIDEAPYQVNYGDICGGVLINPKWAMTTAHCRSNSDFIRIGSSHRLYGKTINISSHIIHPYYGRRHEFDYDIQLLELAKILKFNRYVFAIDISHEIGDSIYVTGWGYPKEKSDYSDVLQQVEVPLVSFERCQEVNETWYNHTLTESMFCAGGRKHDACQGDSGGAAESYGRLVGLSSFGFGCGRGIPGVYTNVSVPTIRGGYNIILAFENYLRFILNPMLTYQ